MCVDKFHGMFLFGFLLNFMPLDMNSFLALIQYENNFDFFCELIRKLNVLVRFLEIDTEPMIRCICFALWSSCVSVVVHSYGRSFWVVRSFWGVHVLRDVLAFRDVVGGLRCSVVSCCLVILIFCSNALPLLGCCYTYEAIRTTPPLKLI
jgi:hypothetical protein